MQILSLLRYLGLYIQEVNFGAVLGADSRVEVVLRPTIARESTTTAFFLLLLKNIDAVRRIGVYARYDTFVVLLRSILLSALILLLVLSLMIQLRGFDWHC